MYVGVLRTFFSVFTHNRDHGDVWQYLVKKMCHHILAKFIISMFFVFFNRMLGFESIGWLGPF